MGVRNKPVKPYSSVVMPALLALMSAFFFFIALKPLLGRRPLVLRTRWLFGFMCLACLPGFPSPLFTMRSHLGMIAWLTPAMCGAILCYTWIRMKGYMVFAVSDTYFREALLAAAASLGYTVEETMSGLKIKETGEVIKVVIAGWIGTAQLKRAKRQPAKLVAQLAHGMNEYFKTNTGKMDYTTSYLCLIMGAFMIAAASCLLLTMHRI